MAAKDESTTVPQPLGAAQPAATGRTNAPSSSSPSVISPTTSHAIMTHSQPIPRWLQLRIKASTFLGSHRRRGTGNVILLPNNKVAKLDCPANEILAMEFVRKHTTIPIPRILEVCGRQPDGSAHLVMSRVPGEDLDDALVHMSPEQVRAVVAELAGYLLQMRRLEPTVHDNNNSNNNNNNNHIGGLGGKKGYDHRLGSHPWGPFDTMEEFHTFVRFGQPLEHWSHEPDVVAIHGKPEGSYKVKFTHADLAPRNIRVGKDGKITGIIDWEFAGWFPEYWEYTKLLYCAPETPVMKKWWAAVAEEEGIEKYEAEKKAEEIIWERAGPFGYD